MRFLGRPNVLGNQVMLCVHDSHFALEVQDVNCMVSYIDALEVLEYLSCRHPCVKDNWLAQLGIPRLVKCVDDEALCFSLCRLECVPVGDVCTMCGFVFGTYHTSRTIRNRFVVYRLAVRTW